MILTFASGKGGIGKSSGALAAAALLARGYRVAFCDLDPDAYATVMGLGQTAHASPLAAHPLPIAHPLLPDGKLLLFPGGDSIADADELAVGAHLARCAAHADIVVVDTPPNRRSPAVAAALRMATVVVIPVVGEYQALAGMQKLMDSMRAFGATAAVRALLSRWEAQTVLARDVHRDLVTSYPGVALSAAIPRDQRVAEAPAAGLPVTLYAPRSAAAEAYRTATREIAATGGLRIAKEIF